MTDLDRTKIFFNDMQVLCSGAVALHSDKQGPTVRHALAGRSGWGVTVGTTMLVFDDQEKFLGHQDAQGAFYPRRKTR